MLNEYQILIDGLPHTVLLTAEDAKLYPTAVLTKQPEPPANKARAVVHNK